MKPSSDPLADELRAIAAARGIPLDDEWLPVVAFHFRRLLEAAAILDQSAMKANDLAPKFEP
jgi:hypothetical protein